MLTIGQLAKRVGVRTSTLRYYEEEGLLTPTDRSDAGYRLYDEAAEQLLRFIQRSQRLGFSLGDIRILLERMDAEELSHDELVRTAEERYLAIEKQMTQWLVVRHEMGLFLQDLHRRVAGPLVNEANRSANSLFQQLVDRVCSDPGAQSATTMLDWLLRNTGCQLSTVEGQRLIDTLRGQHVHVWQGDNDYHILVVSNEPSVGDALNALAQLEADCHVHQHTHQIPELMHNDEGFLLVCRGDNAFLFARLFLSISA
ncbi:MerR family transcriptional regulator [Chloroflexi bacterium TSY]|nr:MerR family transcriptional regulator [Chloroflexi bacterium TSY]